MSTPQPFVRFDIAPINIGKVRGLDAPPSDTMLDTLERQRLQLEGLIGTGCRIVKSLEPYFSEAKDKQDATRKIIGFDRLTDAIRRLMALEQYVVGIRDTRFKFVRDHWLVARKDAVRQSVDLALTAIKADPAKLLPAKSDIDQKKRENLLGDLFHGYRDIEKYGQGSMREIVAGLCETLGLTTDLSVFDPPAEEPVPEDVILPAGHDWIVPHNGDRPYTVVTRDDGRRVRVHWDSAEMRKPPDDPPKTG